MESNRSVQIILKKVVAYTHDTELWSDYWPRIPLTLYFLAAAGIGLIISSIYIVANQGSYLLIGIGALLILPFLAMAFFVRWRWQYRSTVRNQILDSISWRGDELVLDVGCGSGLLLNGVAQRLTSGKALGIDIWTTHGGGGSLNLLWKNARTEKVADKIEFREVDARKMPFENADFDVVVSNGAIHHISHNHADFENVFDEILRVLKPGGYIVITDITHMIEAIASRMPQAGVTCETYEAPMFLNYEHKMVVGRKGGG